VNDVSITADAVKILAETALCQWHLRSKLRLHWVMSVRLSSPFTLIVLLMRLRHRVRSKLPTRTRRKTPEVLGSSSRHVTASVGERRAYNEWQTDSADEPSSGWTDRDLSARPSLCVV